MTYRCGGCNREIIPGEAKLHAACTEDGFPGEEVFCSICMLDYLEFIYEKPAGYEENVRFKLTVKGQIYQAISRMIKRLTRALVKRQEALSDT